MSESRVELVCPHLTAYLVRVTTEFRDLGVLALSERGNVVENYVRNRAQFRLYIIVDPLPFGGILGIVIKWRHSLKNYRPAAFF